MIKRIGSHYGDETCASCVVAGDYIFLAHHAGGFDKDDITHQMRKTFEKFGETLESAGATYGDCVQINLYLKTIDDFRGAREVFKEFFKDGFPARMATTTGFVDSRCLCMIDGIAYKPLG